MTRRGTPCYRRCRGPAWWGESDVADGIGYSGSTVRELVAEVSGSHGGSSAGAMGGMVARQGRGRGVVATARSGEGSGGCGYL
jgi:hypothetical protein